MSRLLKDFAIVAGRSLAAGAFLLRPKQQIQVVQIPEEILNQKLDDLRASIFAEFDVPDVLEPRLEAIETAVMHQAATIEQMKARTEETEENLRRLIGAVEKICMRISAPGSFSSQMTASMAQDEASLPVPMTYQAPQPFFRRITKRGRLR